MRPGQHYVNLPRRRLVKLHTGWLEHKSSQDSKWKWYWCTLRGNVIYIFKNETEAHEQHFGTLSITPVSRFERKDGDNKTGYRFDLHTGRRVNKFRTKKFSDREQWRAFVEGIANGFVSNNVDLPEKLIEDIRTALNTSFTEETGPEIQSRQYQRRGSTGGIAEGFDMPDGTPDKNKFHTMHYLQPVKRPLPDLPPPSPPALDRNSTCPSFTRDFIFYTDASRTDIPCWFFKDCSRDLAMEILIKAAKKGWGNTLMRSRPNSDQQAVLISKLVDKGGSNEFSHYEVKSVPGGYIIVLHEDHNPEKSLEGLMEFFKLRSGSLMTKFLTCNDLRKLGVETDSSDGYPYMRSIARVQLDHESGEQSDQSSSESGYFSAHFMTQSPPSSKEGSAEGSVSSAFSSGGSLQHLVSPISPPPPPLLPPPIPTFSSMPKKGIPIEPPPPAPHDPESVFESRTRISRSQSSVSPGARKSGPPVMPKPLNKACSFDAGIKTETETGLHPISKDLETETSYTIVYADIKKSHSFGSSLNQCFEYINFKTKYGENVDEPRHCMDWKSEEDLITYIEMNPKCAVFDWGKFEEIYEPIENLHLHCKENTGSLEAKSDVTNSKRDQEISIEGNEVNVKGNDREAEILEAFNLDIMDIVKYENMMDDLDCDIFQTINFHQNCLGSLNAEPSSTDEEFERIVEETYELCNEKSYVKTSALHNVISGRKFHSESSLQVHHPGTIEKKGKEGDDYETVGLKSSACVSAQCTLGISTPVEIYEGFECKSDFKHRPRAPSPIFQREQRKTLSEKKSLGCSNNLSVKTSSWDETYDEVQQIVPTDSPVNNYYIDIIASYEDIKAMKLQCNRSIQSSNYKQKKKNFLKQRSKSENNCLAVNGSKFGSCATPNFMKELQGVLKSQGQGQGPVRRLSDQYQQWPEEDPYENIEEIKRNIEKM